MWVARGPPSVAALTALIFIAAITVLTTGLVAQRHHVLDAVLGHHTMLRPSCLTHPLPVPLPGELGPSLR